MKDELGKPHVRKKKDDGEAQFDICSTETLVDLQENDPTLVHVRELVTEDSIEGQSYFTLKNKFSTEFILER